MPVHYAQALLNILFSLGNANMTVCLSVCLSKNRQATQFVTFA